MASHSPVEADSEKEIVQMYLSENISEDEGVTISEPPIHRSRLRKEALTTLHEALGVMFKDVELTDMEIKVQDKVFKCHRVVMAAMSGYFRSLLTSGMQESQNGQAELKDVSKTSFELILLYIYYGEDIINADNVGELLQASVFLRVKPLESECVEFMSRSLTPVNCIGVWKAGKTYGCPSLTEKAGSILLKNFAEVSRLEEFLSLDKDDLVAILDDDHLAQESEDPICDAVLEWVKADLASREEHLDDLMEYVCLPQVSGEFLFDRILTEEELLERNPKFREMKDDALAYQLKPDKRMNIMAKQTKLRSNANLQKVITVIGGYYISEDPQTCMLSFDLKRQKWYTVASIDHEPGEDFATCVLKNEIYVSGGSRSLDKFVRYSPTDNNWSPQPSLITGRECHSMAVIKDHIYILGGRNSQMEDEGGLVEDIEAYNTKRGTWEKVGKLQSPLESLSSVVVKDKIYTFGGLNDNRTPSSAIQCFESSTGACSLAGALPQPTEMSVAITFNSAIYILCAEGIVYRFELSDLSVAKVAEFDARSKFGVFVEGHDLVVVGGEKGGDTLTDEVLKIDVRTGKVARADRKLPIPFSGFRMESLVVPKAMLAQEGFNVMGQNLFDPELEYREQQKRKWGRRHNDE